MNEAQKSHPDEIHRISIGNIIYVHRCRGDNCPHYHSEWVDDSFPVRELPNPPTGESSIEGYCSNQSILRTLGIVNERIVYQRDCLEPVHLPTR